MAEIKDKILPQSYRSVDIDQYNYLRKKSSKDGFAKFLLVILAAVGLFAFVIILSQSAAALDPSGQIGTLYLIAGLLSSAVVILTILIVMFNKEKRIDNTSHLYSFKQDPGKFKIVQNFSDSSVSISTAVSPDKVELDEDGNPIYYAEEVFDDEDNIFAIEEASTLLKKEKALTYAELVASFNESLESFGITGDLAANLLASMAFSKLIDVTKVIDVVPLLFKVLDNPNYVIHYSEKDPLTSQRVLLNTFEYAKTHPNIPVFMLIDEIPSKEYLNYLRPLYRYIDDLNSDYFINVGGTMLHIPHNIYFLSAFKEGSVLFDVSRRYLRYISILRSEYRINTEVEGERKKFTLTNDQLVNARRNSMESFSVEESTFKKLDSLFTLANEANGYVLQNKIQRKIEEFSAVLLSLNMNEEDVIDRCLAYNIIAAVVISADPTKLMKDYNLTTLLDNEFGQDKMKLTKLMIKDYLSLFNSKGERQND